MTYKIKDNEVAVSREIFWLPIDENTPRVMSRSKLSAESMVV